MMINVQKRYFKFITYDYKNDFQILNFLLYFHHKILNNNNDKKNISSNNTNNKNNKKNEENFCSHLLSLFYDYYYYFSIDFNLKFMTLTNNKIHAGNKRISAAKQTQIHTYTHRYSHIHGNVL